MRARLMPALALAGLIRATAAGAAVDEKALFDNIHKTFNTPVGMKFVLKDLKPSRIPGFTEGRLELGEGPQQVQPIQISNDGHYYFLGAAYKIEASKVPGLRSPQVQKGIPEPPPVHITQDGQNLIVGSPLDLTVDPDLDNLKKMRIKGAPGQGPEKAPIVLVEYSDLQCPHCKRAHDSLDKELEAYKGKVRRLFKYYPLRNIHPWAYDAALAAACAGKLKPGADSKMQAAFFNEQAEIKPEQIREKSLAFAEKAGVSPDSLKACLDKGESVPLIDADVKEADSLDVNGTPTIFVNGRRIRGYGWPDIRGAIEEFLNAPKGAK